MDNLSIKESRKIMLRNRAWLDENIDLLQNKFSDQWVGILDQKVVTNDINVEKVKESVGKRLNEAIIVRIPKGEIPAPM